MGVIYKHTSPSGKSYIGQTKHDSWEARAGSDPLKSYESSTKFKHAIEKHGWENFTHEILASGIDDLKVRNDLERMLIEQFDTIKNGYNTLVGGYHDGDTYTVRTSDLSLDFEPIAAMYLEGYSLREVAKEFECSFIAVRGILLQNGVKLRGKGEMPKSFEPKEYPLKSCVVCKTDFTLERKESITCSPSCRSFLGRANSLGVTVSELQDRVTHRPSRVTSGSRSEAAVLSSHTRWHTNRSIVNPDCKHCSQLPL